MCAALGHTPRRARGAPAATLTAKRHQVLVTTPRAFCTNETLFQPSATQVGFKLFANKSRQPSTLLDLRFEERIGVPVHNAIQHRLC